MTQSCADLAGFLVPFLMDSTVSSDVVESFPVALLIFRIFLDFIFVPAVPGRVKCLPDFKPYKNTPKPPSLMKGVGIHLALY